jgi:transposase
MMSDLSWLCPVPLRVKSAQSLISTLPEPEFVDGKLPGYKLASKTVNYPGIEQRWLVVQSQERRESDLGKLSQKITKAQSKAVQDLENLSPEKFAKGLSKLLKEFKYHQINQSKVTQIKSKKKDSSGEISSEISATFSQNESKINTEFLRAERFIIATNFLDSNELTHDSILSEYKAQQSCERGFAFLKDPLFFADSIFLKTPDRIESLGMIMSLCLLVYTLGQRQSWIFLCFQSIHLVTLSQEEHICYWTQERDFIVNLLPYYCFPYY